MTRLFAGPPRRAVRCPTGLVHALPTPLAGAVLLVTLIGCGDSGASPRTLVRVGGSSSVAGLSQAVAEDYASMRPVARITVTRSGSTHGIRRLCDGELDVAGASRPITREEELRCETQGVALLALPIARDGVVVAVNAANRLVTCLTQDELARLWGPAGGVSTWQDLRPAFPREVIHLFGPGPGADAFDFFTRMVVGRAGASRADYHQTNEDHLVARGVAGDAWATGYFGTGSLAGTPDGLRAVAVDAGFGCALPTSESIARGAYSPLSRDLHLYFARSSLGRSEVRDFLHHYVGVARDLALQTGHVPLAMSEYARGAELLAAVR